MIIELFVCNVLDLNNIIYESISNVEVFDDEEKAYIYASSVAYNHMIELKCNDPLRTCKEWYIDFCDVRDHIYNGDYVLALEKYAEWNDSMDEFENCLCIQVDKKLVDTSKFKTITKNNETVSEAIQKLKDVPCPRCGKEVNANDNSCWWCGLDKPIN